MVPQSVFLEGLGGTLLPDIGLLGLNEIDRKYPRSTKCDCGFDVTKQTYRYPSNANPANFAPEKPGGPRSKKN